MQKQDKTMVRTWVLTAERSASALRELAHVHRRDKELSRTLANLGDDLSYVNDDVLDTLSRL